MADNLAQRVTAAYCDTLRHAYLVAKAERLAELRDAKRRTFDSRGTHEFSLEVGRAYALLDLMGVVNDFDPLTLRKGAREDAEAEYRAELFDAYRE